MDIDKCYEVYTKAYGWTNIGRKLTNAMQGELTTKNLDESTSLAIGTQDAKIRNTVRTKKDFEEQLKRLRGV